ncbi:MAG: hypothetical protein CMJ52_06800 [Planctomycetaceae bacterium]|nr:hypothetical protein [Planctomycetaceae bacterium]
MSLATLATVSSRVRRFTAALIVTGLASGCSTSGPDRLEFQSDRYDQAFQAAGEAVRKQGMPPVLTDRTGGVIEARPRLAGSVLEPWRIDNADAGQWGANTLNKQRRRVRFEFLPVDFVPPEPRGEDVLTGPPLPGSTEGELRLTDLETFDGRVELRVWVYVEREHRTGLRRGTWSRVGRTFATNPMETRSPEDGTTRSPGLWTPVGRDEAMERRLLADIRSAMGDD